MKSSAALPPLSAASAEASESLPGSAALTPTMATGSESREGTLVAKDAKSKRQRVATAIVEEGGGPESKERAVESRRQRVADTGAEGGGEDESNMLSPAQGTGSDYEAGAPCVKESDIQRGGRLEEGEEDSKAMSVAKAAAVRQYLKNNETPMDCDADALLALNAKLAELLRAAVRRAHQNGRKTLKGYDI